MDGAGYYQLSETCELCRKNITRIFQMNFVSNVSMVVVVCLMRCLVKLGFVLYVSEMEGQKQIKLNWETLQRTRSAHKPRL